MADQDIALAAFFAIAIIAFSIALIIALHRGSVIWWWLVAKPLRATRSGEPVRYWFGIAQIVACLTLVLVAAVRHFSGNPII